MAGSGSKKRPLEELPHVYAASREEWRAWLAENHAASEGCWLVFYKRASGQPSVTYDEAVEECLCFGWIDSKKVSMDEARFRQLITPRKPKSVWSKVNKERLERLTADGRMLPAGLAKVAAAQADGSWSALDAVEAGSVAPDVAAVLAAVPDAERHWSAFSPGARKLYLYWIEDAKQSETRRKRIAETVALAARNIRSRHDVPK